MPSRESLAMATLHASSSRCTPEASGAQREKPTQRPILTRGWRRSVAGVDSTAAASLLRLAEDARDRMRAADDASARTEVEARYPELLEAMDWYSAEGQPDEAYRIASALVPFWMTTKRIDDGARWLAEALRRPGGTQVRRARALYDHGYLVFWAGQYELAADRFLEARALAERIGDHDLEALALAGSARVALDDDLDEAIRLLRRATEVTASTPDSWGRSSALHVLGVALQMSGDLEEARSVMRQRLDWGRARDDSSVVFVESANLSMVERQLGNLGDAEALSLVALRIAAGKHDEMAIPWVLNGLAAVIAAKGDLERAATLVGIAESLLERAGGEWPPDERAQYEDTLAVLSAAPQQATIEQRRAGGRAKSLDEGVAYAFG